MHWHRKIRVENIRRWLHAFELWFTRASRIAVVMARGAYWLGERRRLMGILGNETFEQFQKNGEVSAKSLEPWVGQIEQVNKRIEAEEALVQKLRFGRANEERME